MIKCKKIALAILTATLILSSSCSKSTENNGNSTQTQSSASVSVTETTLAKPINGTDDVLLGIKKFETSSDKSFALSKSSRVIIASENEAITETASVCISLFNEKLGETEQPLQLVIGDFSPKSSDILLKTDESLKVSDNDALNDQGYTIDIGEYVTITAKTSTGLYYGMMTLLQYSKAYEGIKYGKITDYPDVEERCLHLDCARKYFSKDFIIDMIKDMSYLKMNAFEMHFSENEGLRIQCDTDPEIVSDEYLTKDEVKEIIAVAKKYHVEIIPSFDSPGHLKNLLSVRKEYMLEDTDGYVSEKTLDITNPEAVSYIRSIIAEYAELFSECKYFNIGGDESFGWSNKDRMHFRAWKVLKEYAQTNFGADATAHDTFVNYMNETAKFLEEKGFKVRAWNDGLMRTNEGGGKIKPSSTIDVCYWSDNATLGASSVASFIRNGNNLYNVNEQYLYYVLKPEYNQRGAKDIFNEWHPGVFSNTKFPKNIISLDDKAQSEKIKGAFYCIWCDKPETQTEQQVKEGSAPMIAAMAVKSWNASPSITYSEFNNQLSAIG